MKVTVRDSEILKTIEPNVLEAHLRTFGWHEQGRIHDNAGAIWRRKNDSVDDEFEILLSSLPLCPLRFINRNFLCWTKVKQKYGRAVLYSTVILSLI